MRVQTDLAASDTLQDEIEWFLDYLNAERAASTHTIDAYQRDLRQIAASLRKSGIGTFGEVGADEAAKLRAGFARKKLSTASIQRKMAALRSLLKYVATQAHRQRKPLPQVGSSRAARRLPKALSKDQLESLMSSPDVGLPAGLRDRAMLEVLYGTGLRVSELAALRIENYVTTESLLRVFGKRGKTRIIPIPAATHEWLIRYLESARPLLIGKAATSAIFLNQKGNPLSRSGIFRIIREHAARAGIKTEISPHSLRHTYAVHLVQAGADLRAVQELLGHASVATTEIYTHLDIETLRKKYLDAHPRGK